MRAATIVSLGLLALAGCGSNGDAAQEPNEQDVGRTASEEEACPVGERPAHRVPGVPSVVIGCAELGTTGKPVEFSVENLAADVGRRFCINPAYSGRGHAGIYVPAVCPGKPVPRRLSVVDVRVPRQAVSGYGLVLWGTTAPSAQKVAVKYPGGSTRAAVFPVEPAVTGVTHRPFNVFVAELPSEVAQRPAAAACEDIVVKVHGVPSETARIKPRPRLCGESHLSN